MAFCCTYCITPYTLYSSCIIKILQTFSVQSKSEHFPINALALSLQDSDLPFCMSRDGFGYIRIDLTQTFPELYHKNFTPVVGRIRWKTVRLTLVGRIGCIKMNVLARFLQFLCLNHYFQSIDRYITSFINFKDILQFQWRLTVGLPNLQFYYWAANCQNILYWCQASDMVWCKSEL